MNKLRACAIVIGVDNNRQTTLANPQAPQTSENDARSMSEFLTARGFSLLRVKSDGTPVEETITGSLATKQAVKRTVTYAAEHMEPNGIVVVFFSGHGFSKPEDGVKDGRAEGWCLHGDDDDLLWDREWRMLLEQFKPRTRVVVISDSCFSGG